MADTPEQTLQQAGIILPPAMPNAEYTNARTKMQEILLGMISGSPAERMRAQYFANAYAELLGNYPPFAGQFSFAAYLNDRGRREYHRAAPVEQQAFDALRGKISPNIFQGIAGQFWDENAARTGGSWFHGLKLAGIGTAAAGALLLVESLKVKLFSLEGLLALTVGGVGFALAGNTVKDWISGLMNNNAPQQPAGPAATLRVQPAQQQQPAPQRQINRAQLETEFGQIFYYADLPIGLQSQMKTIATNAVMENQQLQTHLLNRDYAQLARGIARALANDRGEAGRWWREMFTRTLPHRPASELEDMLTDTIGERMMLHSRYIGGHHTEARTPQTPRDFTDLVTMPPYAENHPSAMPPVAPIFPGRQQQPSPTLTPEQQRVQQPQVPEVITGRLTFGGTSVRITASSNQMVMEYEADPSSIPAEARLLFTVDSSGTSPIARRLATELEQMKAENETLRTSTIQFRAERNSIIITGLANQTPETLNAFLFSLRELRSRRNLSPAPAPISEPLAPTFPGPQPPRNRPPEQVGPPRP